MFQVCNYSGNFKCKAYDRPRRGKCVLRKFSPGEEFGPALQYRYTEQRSTDSVWRVYVSARIALPAGMAWVHVWTNRNRQGTYCGTPYAFEVTPRAGRRFGDAAAAAQPRKDGDLPAWTPVSDVLAAQRRLH